MSTITDFAQLGYDIGDENGGAIRVLIELGVIESADDITNESELESLALMGNLVMLDAISDKSVEIEQQLSNYQIEVDKLSGMQEILTDLLENADATGSTLGDLFEFVTNDYTFVEDIDTTQLAIDYTSEFHVSGGFIPFGGQSFETLDEYILRLDEGSGSSDLISLLVGELLTFSSAANNGVLEDVTGASLYNSSGVSGAYNSLADEFIDGDAYLILNNENADYRVALTYEDFRDYLIALRMQEAGFIGEDVFVHPVAFARTNPGASSVLSTPATADTAAVTIGDRAEFYVLFTNVYWGEVTLGSDPDNNLLSVVYNGTAGLREMNIELAEYSQKRSGGTSSSDPYPDETYSSFFLQSRNYANEELGLSNNFDETEGLQEDFEDFPSDDIDVLLESAGTAIESQSTTTEVKLLTVNSSITEWGEMNDVWDLIHEYIHDARKRASDNTL